MSKKDQNDLATNNLLEILRGKKSPDEMIEESEAPSKTDVAGAGAEGFSHPAISDAEIPAGAEESGEPAPETAKKKAKSQFDIRSILSSDAFRKLTRSQKGILALDIGNDSIKYLMIERGKDFERLIGYDILRIPKPAKPDTPNTEEVKNGLKKLFQKINIKEWDVITAVSGQKVSIRHITLPKLPKGELANAIIWNAKKDLPFPKETAFVDYHVLGEMEEAGITKLSVLCGIIDQGVLNEHLALMKEFGIVPVKVIPVPLAIFNAYKSQFGASSISDGIIIEIGEKTSYVIFINQGIIQFAREINMGGEEITTGMIGTISTIDGMIRIDAITAERLKHSFGFPDEHTQTETEEGIPLMQVSSVIRPTLERLASHITRTINYFRNKFGLEEQETIYLSGGTALMKNFGIFLSDSTGKEVKLIDPLRTLVINDTLPDVELLKENAPLYSVCRGISYRETEDINLLPPDLKMLPKLKEYFRYVRLAAIIVFMVISVFSYLSIHHYSVAKDSKNRTEEDLNKLSPVTRRIMQYHDTKERIEQRIQRLDSEIANFPGEVDILSILKMLSIRSPEYITITQLLVAPERQRYVKIFMYYNRGDDHSAEFMIKQFGIILQRSGLFSSVEPYATESSGSDIKLFSIVCGL